MLGFLLYMPTKYRIFFYQGNDLDVNTRVSRGDAWVNERGLTIRGADQTILISKTDIRKADLIRVNGMSRVIRLDHSDGRLYLAVVRFMIGQFACVNFVGTGHLGRALEAP